MRHVQGSRPVKRTHLAALATTLMLFTLRPAIALPVAANVPGGIALIPLGTLLDSPEPPEAWLGDRQVWVAAEDGHWIAVVGVPFDTRAGTQTLLSDRTLSSAQSTVRAAGQRRRSPKTSCAPRSQAQAPSTHAAH